ncbi:DUF3857 and transglutaminase domain-containing protein [Pseudoxanthomonas sp.]|uniref:DUF3857 domain-containing transglutaminase family protein n=1 Tax=Pseudoxanthomonas sp. TaxID=1871049 RepID=UPI002605CACA|nr:DUF3857 and transglutaminase domain-containing protein [Pseudoxanthomonas sp.]WDS36784.1 MAG: DUF3857 and transglutaminase domain-containing protein [Pseudoxanthomonas sp.]
MHRCLTVMALAWLAPAHAKEQPLQVEHERVNYLVQADGTFVIEREVAVKVLLESGLEAARDASVDYSTSIQTAKVTAAYTLKADGRRIDAPPGNFQVNASAGRDGDSPFYSDQTVLSVVFPSLAVGDTTVFAYRVEALKPMFPGQFSIINSYNPATYYGQVEVNFDLPASMSVQHQAWQMLQDDEQTHGDRRQLRWRWKNTAPVDPEALRDSTFDVERYPGYAVSTFANYAQIAQAYGAEASPKAIPDAKVRALARQTVGKEKDPRQRARLLYEWVSRNISYAGNCIGLGAVVPRDLDVMLENHMGDCKDHATLLQALLKAEGIDSTQALVNAGSAYRLPSVPVASVVNHVINYIPAFDLYLDSTAGNVPFGTLPSAVAGKPVLLVEGHDDSRRTPVTAASGNWQRTRTVADIALDGSVHTRMRVELGGAMASGLREQFRQLQPEDVDKLVSTFFRGMGLSATGKVRYEDPQALSDSFWVEADFDVQSLLTVPGGMTLSPWFMATTPISQIVRSQAGMAEVPEGESSCGGLRAEEDYIFRLAAGLHAAALPPALLVEEGNLTYRAEVLQQGREVTLRRVFDDRTPGPTCSADYNQALAAVLRRIVPNVKAQVVLLPDVQ